MTTSKKQVDKLISDTEISISELSNKIIERQHQAINYLFFLYALVAGFFLNLTSSIIDRYVSTNFPNFYRDYSVLVLGLSVGILVGICYLIHSMYVAPVTRAIKDMHKVYKKMENVKNLRKRIG